MDTYSLPALLAHLRTCHSDRFFVLTALSRYTIPMAVQTLRGFRDFYPEDQAKITYLYTKIAATCKLFGYEEFEGPAVESFELYAAKSSDEIVNEQAFLLKSRGDGDDQMVLRPELTPTLARMVAAKQGQLTFPLRWWSWGRFWRYERPQKGRGREFYQWNCDLLGDDSITAEIEILEIVVSFLKSVGLTNRDVVIEVSDRAFLNEQLVKNGITPDQMPFVFKYLDKMGKMPLDERRSYAQELGLDSKQLEELLEGDTAKQSPKLAQILATPSLKGWITANLAIVRGFNYYTDFVFEVSDKQKQFRALLGGGRYSNLVADVGGQPVSGIGFGMGDMVLVNFLEVKGLLPLYSSNIQACVVSLDQTEYAQSVASQLRAAGINSLSYATSAGPGKGLKFASQKKVPFALIIGQDEATNQTVTVKDLESGEQKTVKLEEAINLIRTTNPHLIA